MLGPADAIELPPGVRVEGGLVADDARGACFPANETALFVLLRTGRPLCVVADELAVQHRLEPERARSDVLRFALSLNRAELANIVAGDSVPRRVFDWLVLACRLLPAGALPSRNVRRFALETSTPVRAALSTFGALRWRTLSLALAGVLVAAPGGLTPGLLALGLGLGVGLAAHEAGHVALLAGIGAALVVAGLRTYVIHPALAPRRRRAVAAAGPGAAALLGVAAVAAAWLAGLPELALAGCPVAAHAVGLTVATGDGRVACGL